MKKNILKITIITLLFLTSCKETKNQESKEIVLKETVSKATDEIITGNQTDKSGTVLEYTFNNTKNTATLKLNGETIELGLDSAMASGSHYKNKHYNYSEWHGKTTIKKDGKIIFEAGEETMPK